MKILHKYFLGTIGISVVLTIILVIRKVMFQSDDIVLHEPHDKQNIKQTINIVNKASIDKDFEIKGHEKEKIYYGTNEDVAAHFNDEEMMEKYKTNLNYSILIRRFPQCICIGSLKSGTQALLEFLDLHSNIKVAPHEVRYFKFDDKFDMIGYEKYLRKMPYSTRHQITFEKSPQYTAQYSGNDKRIPERIHSLDPSMKLLFIARNPIDRAVSEYLHNERAHANKNRTFQELVMKNDGNLNTFYVPLQNSMYYRVLKIWYHYFPKKQIHIVDGDNLMKHPVEELAQIESFLNLPHRITENMFYFNKTKGFYCYYTKQGSSKCLWPTKGNRHPALQSNLQQKLEEFFFKMNEKFYILVGRKFDWNT